MDIPTCVLDELEDAICAVRAADGVVLGHNAKFVEWFGSVEGGALPEAVRVHVDPILRAADGSVPVHKPYAKPIALEVKPPQKRPVPTELVVRQSAEPGVVAITIKNIAKLVEKDAMLKSFTALVDQSNRTLKRQKQAVSELLDNMRQAVFVFDERGVIHEPVSAYARVVFGHDLAGKSVFGTVFGSFGPSTDEMEIVKAALAYAFGADDFQWTVNVDKLPERFEYEAPNATSRQRLRAAYTPLWNDDAKLERVMMVVEDVTQIEHLERALAVERAASARRLTVIDEIIDQDGPALAGFISAFERALVRVDEAFASAFGPDGELARASIARVLHTVKGNARTLGLRLLAEAVHRGEDQFAASQRTRDSQAFRSALDAIRECFDVYRDTSSRILSSAAESGHSNSVAVERTFLEELQAALRARLAPDDSLLTLASRLTNVKLARLKRELDAMAGDLGAQLGKDVRVELVDGGISVPKDTYDRIHDCLVHLLRNAIDHGVEDASERAASGKPETATVTVTISYTSVPARLSVVVMDDGRGIDPSRVLDQAMARGLITQDEASTANEARVFELLLVRGFSTSRIVSQVSGRGVGLDAVNALVREQGGELRVASDLGRGTSFSLVFPRERSCA